MRIKEQVGEIEVDANNKIIIIISEFSDKFKIDIRNWFLVPDGTWIATKRGITFEAKHINKIIRMLSLIDVSLLEQQNKEIKDTRDKEKLDRQMERINKNPKTYIP